MNEDEQKLQNICDALEMFYEESGYEDFYEKELKYRTPQQIYELYEATFGDDLK